MSCTLFSDFTQKCHGHNVIPGQKSYRPGHTAKSLTNMENTTQNTFELFMSILKTDTYTVKSDTLNLVDISMSNCTSSWKLHGVM